MTPAEARAELDRLGAAGREPRDLAETALLFAAIDAPEADLEAVRMHLAMLGTEAARFRDTAPEMRAGRLAALLAGRHGYAGDAETYDDPANANLIRVVERRRGLPVALGILWIHAARAAGWSAWGIDFPAHFLVGIEGTGGPEAVDPFARGHVPSAGELRALLERIIGQRVDLHPGLFRRMRDCEVLLRLQNNIKVRRLKAGDPAGALACIEDMLRLVPDAVPLWREAGLVNDRLDRPRAAIACLERFLAFAPGGEGEAEAHAALAKNRTRLN